jgi:hypothetical protein
MGAVFSFVFGLWFVAAIFYAPYCWAKKTDKSDEAIVRRFKALGYGLLWPLDAYNYFNGKADRQAQLEATKKAEQDILG